MKFSPRPHQLEIMLHASAHERCACWSGMGTGKTSAILTQIANMNELGIEEGPTLVLAPLRVAQSVWPAEVEKWDHLRQAFRVSPIVGDREARRRALRADANLFTINYDNLLWLSEELQGRWPFKIVIADESTRLKGFRSRQGGKRAQALARYAHRGPAYWINLTGTPAPNGLKDLWGQTWFLDAGLRLGRTFAAFEERWFRRGFDGYSLAPMPFAEEQIHARLHDICRSIVPPVVDEPIFNDIWVELPSKAMRRYQEMEREMFTLLEGEEIEAFNAAARTQKCLQLANGFAYTEEKGDWKEVHTAKLEALESVIEEAAGMPVLVVYQFVADRARILENFKQARVLDSNPKTIDEWNAGKIPMLLLHPASGGHGLNLQDGSNIMAFFGVNWDLELYQQVIERIGPMRQKQSGYNRPVFVHRILARDTMDGMVLKRLDDKREVQDILMEATRSRK